MANYYNYLQPSIIKFTDEDYPELPKSLVGKYILNYNIIGIKYFAENFMLIEDEDRPGQFMYMVTNDFEPIALDVLSTNGKLDIPRAYIVLTEDFISSQENFRDWALKAISDNSIYVSGTEKFQLGRDYFLNETVYTFLVSEEFQAFNGRQIGSRLPNYLSEEFTITKWYQDIPEEEASWLNFEYFYKKNKVKDYEYSEDELDNVSATFYAMIQNLTTLDEQSRQFAPNAAYDIAMKYFMNNKSDAASAALGIVLNTKTTQTVPETVETCSCQVSSSGYSVNSSCYDIYKQAMNSLSAEMLSSTAFYKDWMFTKNLDGTLMLNDALVDSLISLLTEYESLDIDLSFSSEPQIYNSCCQYSANDIKNINNHKIIENYIQVLNWIKNGCIDNNANKIKIYGQKFGELLSQL